MNEQYSTGLFRFLVSFLGAAGHPPNRRVPAPRRAPLFDAAIVRAAPLPPTPARHPPAQTSSDCDWHPLSLGPGLIPLAALPPPATPAARLAAALPAAAGLGPAAGAAARSAGTPAHARPLVLRSSPSKPPSPAQRTPLVARVPLGAAAAAPRAHPHRSPLATRMPASLHRRGADASLWLPASRHTPCERPSDPLPATNALAPASLRAPLARHTRSIRSNTLYTVAVALTAAV